MQIKNGTHAILPVAAHLRCVIDHARMPVMWLRHSHGKMRHDGSHAALLQRHYAVDERGGLHGAPGLAAKWSVAFRRAFEGLVVNGKGSENG